MHAWDRGCVKFLQSAIVTVYTNIYIHIHYIYVYFCKHERMRMYVKV